MMLGLAEGITLHGLIAGGTKPDGTERMNAAAFGLTARRDRCDRLIEVGDLGCGVSHGSKARGRDVEALRSQDAP